MLTKDKLILIWLAFTAMVCGSDFKNVNEFSEGNGARYTEDAVIVHAPVPRVRREVVNNTRTVRQLFLMGPRMAQTTDDGAFGTDCETTLGKKGTCKSFRDCYPLFKVVDLSGWDGWVMGHYDTCSFINSNNMEVFGVCCTAPVGTPPQQEPDVQRLGALPPVLPAQAPPTQFLSFPGRIASSLTQQWTFGEANRERQIPANWPPTIPPLPTHPPDHTAPTHPPSIGNVEPTRPTTSRPPSTASTTWGTKPPSTTKQTWPPAYPTQPTKPTGQPAVDSSCGIKNGPQTYGTAYELQDEERIVGGHNADLNEWPWIAALFNGGRQFCGGSLIDDIHILSAAHCVAHMTSWDVARLTARLGDHNIRTNTETQHEERKIKRVVRHRGFNMQTLYNDVAILTLDKPVKFSKTIRPICLPSGNRAYAGQVATVIGWGSLRESGPQPSVLQEVSIPIWQNGECRLKYGSAAPGGIVDHMICAGKASMDSCSGDSGGPLMVNEGGRWTQVGVVSWGIGCGKGQYPGVYTRVTAFLPWIQKNSKN
ncbi:PREDICTED: proclotting enzyme-like isoform X2 [Papilio xuthus]|uniref:Phenoloxidase-activating factor 2 n=1 Tax=Papilio xuthus TaxID=66420 RepID=A0AAJ6ZPQ0_PAPXU|nr:PREDICTED: proclotting enzyme-like isoform X2 [Papilio xuthus]